MRIRRPRVLIASSFFGGVAAVVACREPTQIVVDIRLRDAECSEIKTASVAMTADDTLESQLAAVTTDACDAKHIGSLTAIPAGDGDTGKVFVRVVVGFSRRVDTCTEANGYAGCTVARRRVSYRPHATTTVPIYIDKTCEDEPCATRTTCNRDRDCENADLDGACGGDTCVLPSDRAPGSARDGAASDAARDVSPGDAASFDAGIDVGSGGGPNGRAAKSGPGTVCLSARCTAPTGTCSYFGAGPQCAASGGTGFLDCDESSDCNSGSRCCFSTVTQTSQCTTGSCTDAELCWKDSSCPSGSICANTTSSMVFGDFGECRSVGTPGSLPCRLILSCTAGQSCLLNPNGMKTCGIAGTGPYVGCTGVHHCPSAACLLYPVSGVAQHAACGPIGGNATELCDQPGACSNGKTCSNDYVDVGFGYYLRICR